MARSPEPTATGRDWAGLAVRLAGPAAILAAALVLPGHILSSDRAIRGSGVGPTAWPRVMLALVALLAVVWMVQVGLAWRRGSAAVPAPDEGAYSYTKAAAGLALVVAYGWLLPIVGFPLATASFIAAWCFVGDLRRPLAVGLIAVLGTVALLWIFMGVATMPLSRGVGAFDRFSIALLQLIGVY